MPVTPWAAEAALIARPLNTVEVTKLRPGEDEFLYALSEGEMIVRCAEIARCACPDFDVSQAIVLLIKARIVAGFWATRLRAGISPPCVSPAQAEAPTIR